METLAVIVQNHVKMKFNHKLFLVTFLLLVIPLFIYIGKFHSHNFSNDTSVWSDFSTYIAGFVSIANLIIFILLTKEIHDYNLKKDELNSKQEKPIISFKLVPGYDGYFAENVGKGTALNVIICGDLQEQNQNWREAYKYYSFVPNSEKKVKVAYRNALLAKYTDIYGVKYISFMDDDHLRYFEVDIEKVKNEYPEEFKKANYTTNEPTWLT